MTERMGRGGAGHWRGSRLHFHSQRGYRVSGFSTQRIPTAAYTALRIAAGLTFTVHGAQKMLGWFGGFGANGATVEYLGRFGIAGGVELIGGLLITLGLFTRFAALIASGEMAVAYFWMHVGGSGKLFWWENRGEVVMLYAFLWLLVAAAGAGPISLDAALRKKG
jgi:putative oxidoreductase